MAELFPALILGFGLWAGYSMVNSFVGVSAGLTAFHGLSLIGPGVAFYRRVQGQRSLWESLMAALVIASLGFQLTYSLLDGSFMQIPSSAAMLGATGFLGFVLLEKLPSKVTILKRKKHSSTKGAITLDREGLVSLTPEMLTLHTQILGGTGTGKTAFAVKPMLEQAIKLGYGAFVYDVKSNLVQDTAAYLETAGRKDDLFYFDLSNPSRSQTYNPLAGSDPDQISNRLITALYYGEQTEPYYRDLGSAFLSNLIPLLMKETKVITFLDLYTLIGTEISSFRSLDLLCSKHYDDIQAAYFRENWLDMAVHERQKVLSGLVNKLSRFVTRTWSPLINAKKPDITMADVFENKGIFVFGIAALENPEDSRPLAVMALMDLASQVAKRFKEKPDEPFLVFLDEFWNVEYPGFVDLINKAREAKVGFVLSHQSMGDLAAVSPEFADQVLTNTQNKIILASSHPPTAEYLARLMGTQEGKPRPVYSFSTQGGGFGLSNPAGFTEVVQEEFRFHPNLLKELAVGEAVVRIMTPQGPRAQRVKLKPGSSLPDGFNLDRAAQVRNRHLRPSDSSLPFAEQKAPGRKVEGVESSEPLLMAAEPGPVDPGNYLSGMRVGRIQEAKNRLGKKHNPTP